MQGERVTQSPLTPSLWRVADKRRETADVTTILLVPESGPPSGDFQPGQFNMLSALGVGEAAISISSAPAPAQPLAHTVRDVGPVTHALCAVGVGGLVGVRGPFGTGWQLAGLEPRRGTLRDVIVIAGGIGLAPLRGAVEQMVSRARGGGEGAPRLHLFVGAREPAQIMYSDDMRRWQDAGAEVLVTVDVGGSGWGGHVGLVTSLIDVAAFDPQHTAALICGPEVMMRFSARALTDRGVPPERIRVSLERNMQCGIGWCGHCQLGPFLLCRDGPVVPYSELVGELMAGRQL